MKLKKSLWILLLVVFLDSLAYNYSNVIGLRFLTQYLQQYNVNTFAFKLSYYIPLGSTLVFLLAPIGLFAGPIVGFFSDIWGRKKLLLGVYFIVCLLYLLTLFSTALDIKVTMLVSITLLGINIASFSLLQAIVVDISANKKIIYHYMGFLLAIILVAAYIAQSTDYMLGEKLLEHHIINTILLMGFVLKVCCFFLVYFFFEEKSPAFIEQIQFIEKRFEKTFKNLSTSLSQEHVCSWLWALLLVFFAWSISAEILRYDIIQVLKYSSREGYIFYSYRILILVLSLILVYPFLLRRLSPHRLLILSVSCAIIGLFIMHFDDSSATFWPFSILECAGLALSNALLWSLIANASSDHCRGTILGIADFVWVLAWTLSGIFSIYMEDYSNFLLPAMILPLVLVLLIVAKASRRQNSFKQPLKQAEKPENS